MYRPSLFGLESDSVLVGNSDMLSYLLVSVSDIFYFDGVVLLPELHHLEIF